jgi:hypothetical protein
MPSKAAAVAEKSVSSKKNANWWEGAREPADVSTVQLAKTRPEWGGEYLILWIGKDDGKELVSRGLRLLGVESVKKRTVTLKAEEEGEGVIRKRGLHKVRLNKATRPHIHLPVEDGKFKFVEKNEEQNQVEMRFDGDRVIFDLPPSIR